MQDQTDQAFVEPHQFSAIHQFSAHSKVFCSLISFLLIQKSSAYTL
jgi:hypothetical protein